MSLFTIIIPTLNEEQYLPKLLSDLQNQKFKDFEVVIVDANSVDETAQKAKLFQEKLKLELYKVKRKNLAYQRNFGARKAKGRYLIFLDADARVSQLFTKNLINEIEKSKHLIYLPVVMPEGGDYGDRILFKVANMLVEVSQNTPKPLATGSAMVLYKEFFHLLGGYDDSNHDKKVFYPEDHDLIIRARKSGVRAKVAKNVKFRFSLRRMKTEGRFNVLKKYILMAVEMTVSGKARSSYEYEMGGQIYNAKKKTSNKQFNDFLRQVKRFRQIISA